MKEIKKTKKLLVIWCSSNRVTVSRIALHRIWWRLCTLLRYKIMLYLLPFWYRIEVRLTALWLKSKMKMKMKLRLFDVWCFAERRWKRNPRFSLRLLEIWFKKISLSSSVNYTCVIFWFDLSPFPHISHIHRFICPLKCKQKNTEINFFSRKERQFLCNPFLPKIKMNIL